MMSLLGKELSTNADEIAHLWYEAWRNAAHAPPALEEAALKDLLPLQLRQIGEELRKSPGNTVKTGRMRNITERLDPEAHVSQETLIEEIIQEYRLIFDVIRQWIEQRNLKIFFEEYSYFYQAIFELMAESVRRYSEFQAAEVAKDRAMYLASIAHQMRSPLTVLSHQMDVIELSEGALDDESIQRLRRNINRLFFLVNGVMRFERYRIEDLPVRPRCVYLSELIDTMVRDSEFEARAKGLRLEISVNRTLQMTVDPDLFIDAFGNLLQNAIRYTDNGFVRVESEEEGSHVIVRISDSGPGISSERLKQLFMPTRSASPAGGGIGLTIAQRSIAAQGGKIAVQTEIGKGSVFSIHLPKEVCTDNGRQVE